MTNDEMEMKQGAALPIPSSFSSFVMRHVLASTARPCTSRQQQHSPGVRSCRALPRSAVDTHFAPIISTPSQVSPLSSDRGLLSCSQSRGVDAGRMPRRPAAGFNPASDRSPDLISRTSAIGRIGQRIRTASRGEHR